MKTFKFTNVNNINDSFTCTCYPHEAHNLQNHNEDFRLWSEGKIITYEEIEPIISDFRLDVMIIQPYHQISPKVKF